MFDSHYIFGGNRSDSTKILSNTGEVLRSQDIDFEGALLLYEKSVFIKKLLGSDDTHPEILKCVNNIGVVLFKQGKIDEAIAQLERAMVGLSQMLGNLHSKTFLVKTSLDIVSLWEDASLQAWTKGRVSRRSRGNERRLLKRRFKSVEVGDSSQVSLPQQE